VGVREDLGIDPVHPKPLPYRYSVRDALPWITAKNPNNFKVESETDISRYAIGKEWDKLKPGEQSDKYFSCVKVDAKGPCPAIQASHGGSSIAQPLHPTERRKFTIDELKRICAFSDDFILKGSYAQQWERLGNSVPPVMMKAIAETIRDEVLNHG
jgi:DNA (cytosine-5)-methyltransferase 1